MLKLADCQIKVTSLPVKGPFIYINESGAQNPTLFWKFVDMYNIMHHFYFNCNNITSNI